MKNTLVSVIIPTFYGGENLRRSIQSVVDSSYLPIEAIIIDNSPSLDTLSPIRKEFADRDIVHFFKSKRNLYFAAGINYGITKAKGGYVLIFEDDTVLEKNCVKYMIGAIEKSPNSALVYPSMLKGDGKSVDLIGAAMDYLGFCRKILPSGKAPFKMFYIALGLYRRNIFEKVGGFDADFTILWEDADLSWRIRLTGYDIKYVKEAVIYHNVSESVNKMTSYLKTFHIRKNRLCGMMKNYNLFHAIIFVSITILLYLIFSLIEIFKYRSFVTAKATVCAIWWNISHFSDTRKKRMFVQKKLRKISDAEIMKFLFNPLRWLLPK